MVEETIKVSKKVEVETNIFKAVVVVTEIVVIFMVENAPGGILNHHAFESNSMTTLVATLNIVNNGNNFLIWVQQITLSMT